MGKINWGRVVLCGLIVGGVAFLLNLTMFVFALGGTEIAAAVDAAGPRTQVIGPLYLAVGIWAMWLYAAIRPRYGPGPKTAAVAGLALWVFAALADAMWIFSGLTTISLRLMLVPLAAALPVVIVAMLLGAWPYKE